MFKFYRKIREGFEYCFNIETSGPLTQNELEILKWLLAETFEPDNFGSSSKIASKNRKIIELGPRLNFATAFSTNAVSICHACGLDKVTRLEVSRRYILPVGEEESKFISQNHDRMTECYYQKPLLSFETGIKPEPVKIIPLLEEGPEALRRINKEMGLGMDDWDIYFYHNMFTTVFKRNPTDVECFQLGQANSEHSRHWFFKGKLVIDGKEMSETLLEIIQSTLRANPANSVIAFKDNSSGIKGYDIWTIIPKKPGRCSPFSKERFTYHIIFTAETHNFPSGVAPFPGAETGTGGRIRDIHATGRGAFVGAATVGYCVGSLNIFNFSIPGEEKFNYPSNLASPLEILIEESNGASDYGNKFGEPVILGFTRTFDLKLPDGERRAWIKPIMFTGGIGQIDNRHIEKGQPKKGMLIVQIGGPAYRIGVGGGSASSMIQGENIEELDFNAVQRGDAEMEQKMNRVIRACVEMGDKNPIISIHDQGAGGPCNVLTELVNPVGGRVEIRNITLGDKTMSVLEIWGGEYQERDALLIWPDKQGKFQKICQREKVTCEILGHITGDGKIVVHDAQDNSTPVNLELEKILGKMPQKTFEIKRVKQKRDPFELPTDLKIKEAINMIFSLPSVGSKGYLVRKVDRSVTGLIAQQQCCGPLQLPVSDVAVIAQSHFGLTGAATSVGEQPIKMLVDIKAGARMAVGEMLTNMAWAKISTLEHIKCSVNWMWAAKLPGEGALIYDAACAIRDLMIELGIAADGGKDSLSMAAKVEEEIVKAPGQLVISGYAPMPDITKVVTPDIKKPGTTKLILIDPADGKNRLGGSALAQAFGQIGDTAPDVDDPKILANSFLAVQEMVEKDLILSGHDRSDGGLITTLAEMAMSGTCGMVVNIDEKKELIPELFSEELGLVIEYLAEKENEIISILLEKEVPFQILGITQSKKVFEITHGKKRVLSIETSQLRKRWEKTSSVLETFQMDPDLAYEEETIFKDLTTPPYYLSFNPENIYPKLASRKKKPKVAVIREEGSNGDREMASAFFAAGFEVWDVTMTDLLKGDVSLKQFRGIAFPGGFSYADVLDSAKGWAGVIRFNSYLREMFDEFYIRKNTFSLGICNGCQLMTLLGWLPWKGLPDEKQPRFIRNFSGRFESRWVTVKIEESPSIMLKGMEGSVLGIWVAHGEGRLFFPDKEIGNKIILRELVPITYVDNQGHATTQYPFNPNGSVLGIAGLCSLDGRHLAMMPHPERCFLKWQWPWMPEGWKKNLKTSPWLKMFQNARIWCEETS